jgi:hypothetical protein
MLSDHDVAEGFIREEVPRYVDRPAQSNHRLPKIVRFNLAPRPFGTMVHSFMGSRASGQKARSSRPSAAFKKPRHP